MKEKLNTLNKKKIALVHVVKKELNLSDAQYRDILEKACGVRSAKDLDEQNFRRLMAYFVRSGHYRLNKYGLTIKQKLFIKYLARGIKWDGAHLANFINKYYHKSGIEKLTKKEAAGLIESLKNIKARRGDLA